MGCRADNGVGQMRGSKDELVNEYLGGVEVVAYF